MILSNIQGRGLLKGVLSKGGGGGGVTDYNQLSSKPQINGVTIENNHDGGYYGLIDSVDIEVTEIYEIGYGSNYDVNLNGAAVHVTNKIFKGATNSTNGTKGLVPAPAAGSVGKILSNEGWIDPPSSIVNYSTNEQNTGRKWFDNKDIYFKSGSYQIPSGTGVNIIESNITSYIDKLINVELCLYYTDGSYQYSPVYISTTAGGYIQINSNNLCFNSVNEDLGSYTAYYTIYYTKK